MKTTRLLLPFTHGVDMDILECAVLLAKERDATLVPLALIHVSGTRWSKGARLEHIQQAKDFLEAVQHKAVKHAVVVERFEVFTADVVQSLSILVQEIACDGLLVFVRGRESMLLSADVVEHIIGKVACKFYIVHLPAKRNKRLLQMLLQRLVNSLSRLWRQQDRRSQTIQVSEEQMGQRRDTSDLETITRLP